MRFEVPIRITVLELPALDGRALGYLGISMSGLQTADMNDPAAG